MLETDSSDATASQLWNLWDQLRSSAQPPRLSEFLDEASRRDIRVGWRELAEMGGGLADFAGVLTPPWLIEFLSRYFADRQFSCAFDPAANAGSLLAAIVDAGIARSGIGITQTSEQLRIAQHISGDEDIVWKLGDPLQLPDAFDGNFDLVISCPPLGWGPRSSRRFQSDKGDLELRGERDMLLMIEACRRLSPDGEAVILRHSGFFLRQRQAITVLSQLGLTVHSNIYVPNQNIIPGTSVPLNLVFLTRRPMQKLFVGSISRDSRHDMALADNLRSRVPGEDLGLGSFVEIEAFYDYPALESQRRAAALAAHLEWPRIPLSQVVEAINTTRATEPPGFEEHTGAVYLPLEGHGKALSLLSDLRLQPRRFAQLIVDTTRANPVFLVEFFNSPIGLSLRESIQLGSAVRTITKQRLAALDVFLPALDIQSSIVEARTRLRALKAALDETGQRLFEDPKQRSSALQMISLIAPEEQAQQRLETWIDTLPFPLASIVWAYHASGNQDKVRYEHLLHFFEALAQFIAVLLLSGFKSDRDIFRTELQALSRALPNGLSAFETTTFGTWRAIVERLAKELRAKLDKTEEAQWCRAAFHINNPEPLAFISSKDLVSVLQEVNGLRNKWTGHGGIVGEKDAHERHRILESHLATVREIFGIRWTLYELITPGAAKFSNGLYKYEAARLMGNRTPFEKITVHTAHAMEDGQLYLLAREEHQPLKLIPFVRMAPSPTDAINACYFYNRRVKEGLRFVSYHFAPESVVTDTFADTAAVLESLTSGG